MEYHVLTETNRSACQLVFYDNLNTMQLVVKMGVKYYCFAFKFRKEMYLKKRNPISYLVYILYQVYLV